MECIPSDAKGDGLDAFLCIIWKFASMFPRSLLCFVGGSISSLEKWLSAEGLL